MVARVPDWHRDVTTRAAMVNDTNKHMFNPEHSKPVWSFYVIWGLSIPMVSVTFMTLMANGTVLLMFILTRVLRKCKNIYIASLAMADFLIGCTMPIAMLQDLNPNWALVGCACKLSLTFRHSLLYVSLLSILLISIDRWWSIHYPFSYRVRQSRRLALGIVCLCWFLSLAIHIPPIVLWDLIADIDTNSTSSTSYTCDVPYRRHFAFTLTASAVEYLVPVMVLWGLNCSIYFKISRRKSMKIRRSLSASDTFILTYRKSSSESDCTTNPSDESADLFPNSFSRLDIRRTSLIMNSTRRHSLANYLTPARASSAPAQYSRMSVKRRVSFDTLMGQTAYRPSAIRKSSMCGTGLRSSSVIRKQSDDLVRDLLVKQDKKAACSLGMLVLVFTLCWTPYMVSSVVYAKCDTCLASWVRTVAFWVLMANSAINPFLYGLLNAEFRKVLRQWFFCPKTRKYRLKEALLYWNLQQGMDSEGVRDNGFFPAVRE
ncbi:tyramine receptor Ser-2-like [Haliotis asinina]|uniref:tyramine receptor Ser-2-like n=1 Tax=Haliotis asinina TaxID=109174 RepID=UPI003531B5AF